MDIQQTAEVLRSELIALGTEQQALATARFFPEPIVCLGALATDIGEVTKQFHLAYTDLSGEQVLALSEHLLAEHQYHEEVMLAFSILDKYVGKHVDDALLFRFKYWLEHHVSNWAQVDNLCMKTIYRFCLKRTELLPQLQSWIHSPVPWCRRAVNVVWLKFINRKIGKTYYRLPVHLVFENCENLIADKDVYVQKSIGWLLKVTSTHYRHEVISFLQEHIHELDRATLRYAIEKLDSENKKALLAMK